MKPEEIRQLLGGYATGTLSDDERNLLFSAALEDQELFDALADEEALRELLAEPATREALIEELRRQPVLDAPSLRDHAVPPQPVFASAAMPGVAKPFWSRMAVAGGLAMILLVAGVVQYQRMHAPEEVAVNLAMNRPPERNAPTVEAPSAAPSVRDKEPAPKPIPRSATVPSLDAREGSRQIADAGLPAAAPKREEANSIELDRINQRNNESRAVIPPTVASNTADEEKKTEKETVEAGQAREQLNQAVRDQVARAAAGSPAPPAATFSTPPVSSGKIAERKSALVTPSQIVVGGLSRAADRRRDVDAKVTDVNGTIVSINAGTNSGFKVGDTIEIVRDNRVIATSKLSQVGATFAVGQIQPAAGSTDTPRTGDNVRRAASQPKQ